MILVVVFQWDVLQDAFFIFLEECTTVQRVRDSMEV